ncbi:MAG: HD domain-containing protein [Chloroflexota bacterium]|nr:HD domain-containing protein [Chloroflexota bacterium]
MLRRARHRAGQFFGALRPRVDADERADAYRYLTDNQRRIFESMMLRDQQHGIEVLRRVRASAGGDDAALCTAALLHDCGKGNVRLWHRVAHVLLGAVAPGLRSRIASERGAAWRRAMWRLLHHADIGARMAEAAGSDAEVVRLIREQEASAPDARLALLQAADEA